MKRLNYSIPFDESVSLTALSASPSVKVEVNTTMSDSCTIPGQSPELVRRVVVVFDICSSTTILQDLKETDNLAAWRDLLIYLKSSLVSASKTYSMEIYKFIGDGWILMFPVTIRRESLRGFITDLAMDFDSQFDMTITPLLQRQPASIGLTFGIDAGELIQVEMNSQPEYIGKGYQCSVPIAGSNEVTWRGSSE
jgi:hypothetical protein